MTNKIISPKFSLKNWKGIKWLKGNFKDLKPILKYIGGYAIAWIVVKNPVLSVPLSQIGKSLFDILEYYIKQY